MSRLIDVAAVLDRMANVLRGTEQGGACAFAVKLMRERESMTDEAQELAEALRNTVAILEEWHTDRPDDIGAKEPAILSAANSALARHRAKQEVQS